MKEGYIQLKISELNERLQKIEELLKFEDNKLKLLDEKFAEYKYLIKKLKDIQNFKEESLKEIKAENEKLITEEINRISNKLQKILNEHVSSKSNKINETLTFLKKQEKELAEYEERIKEHTKNITFLLEHNEFLMMKLVNKSILTGFEVTEMQRRATKKANKTE